MNDTFGNSKLKTEVLVSARNLSDKIAVLLNKISLDADMLPNIGTTYNNKILEILCQMESSGISIDNDLLFLAIRRYLVEILNRSSLILISYAQTFSSNSKLPFFMEKSLSKKRDNLAKRYKDLDDQIYSFSIFKDILKVIEYDMERGKENEKIGKVNIYNDDSRDIIESYRIELQLLGVSDDVIKSLPNVGLGVL